MGVGGLVVSVSFGKMFVFALGEWLCVCHLADVANNKALLSPAFSLSPLIITLLKTKD
jgi:hypothetical protein